MHVHIFGVLFIAYISLTSATYDNDAPKLEPEYDKESDKKPQKSEHSHKIYFAINDNNQEGGAVTMQQRKWADLVRKLHKYVSDSRLNTVFRASKTNPMFSEPEYKRISGDKTSLVVELNPESILNVLSEVMKSDHFQEKVNKYVKKAAVLYRSLRSGLFEDEKLEHREVQRDRYDLVEIH